MVCSLFCSVKAFIPPLLFSWLKLSYRSMLKYSSVPIDWSVLKFSSVPIDWSVLKYRSVPNDWSVLKFSSVLIDWSVPKFSSMLFDWSMLTSNSMRKSLAEMKRFLFAVQINDALIRLISDVAGI